ncbi:calphotin-like [Ostrinia furnacalis]|uniref:calphotin-like n=1 Tax=Ostrinia furnacalis TaxID=93504 RepID=UPI001038FD75|nr:calphotin-like [Ostrinia furnacalis]
MYKRRLYPKLLSLIQNQPSQKMKLLIALAALVAVSVAVPFKPADSLDAELDAIVAAIQSPNTDPATAALLEQQLHEIIAALSPEIVASPILVEEEAQGPQVPDVIPEIINIPDLGEPSPIVVPTPVAPSSSALVQIIVNVKNSADVGVAPIVPAPIVVSPIEASPIQVVEESFDNNPIEASPIQIVDVAPVPAEPVLIAEPIAPIPVVNIPGIGY